jgi:hypothetical protein
MAVGLPLHWSTNPEGVVFLSSACDIRDLVSIPINQHNDDNKQLQLEFKGPYVTDHYQYLHNISLGQFDELLGGHTLPMLSPESPVVLVKDVLALDFHQGSELCVPIEVAFPVQVVQGSLSCPLRRNRCKLAESLQQRVWEGSVISMDVDAASEVSAIVLIQKITSDKPSSMICSVLLGPKHLPDGLIHNMRHHEVIETNVKLEVILSDDMRSKIHSPMLVKPILLFDRIDLDSSGSLVKIALADVGDHHFRNTEELAIFLKRLKSGGIMITMRYIGAGQSEFLMNLNLRDTLNFRLAGFPGLLRAVMVLVAGQVEDYIKGRLVKPVTVKTETTISFRNVNPADMMAMVMFQVGLQHQGVRMTSTRKTHSIQFRAMNHPALLEIFGRDIESTEYNDGSLIVLSPPVKFVWETFPRALAAFKITSWAYTSGDNAVLLGGSAVPASKRARDHYARDPGASHVAV